jgi:hypothetical protein
MIQLPLRPSRNERRIRWIALSLATALAGCTALDADPKASPATSIPIKTASGSSGIIESAELSIWKGHVYVWGYVRRQSIIDPAIGSHIDVSVLDASGRTLESVTVDYTANEIPYGKRGAPAHSMFTARLTKVPASGATVLVAFDSGPKSGGAKSG